MKIQRDHRSTIRSIFSDSGFSHVLDVSDKQITFDNQSSDIDDIFIYENIIVVAEYTCAQPSGIGDHLKNKKIFFDKILNNPTNFVKFLRDKFPNNASKFAHNYHLNQLIIRILYCSRYDFDEKYKINVPGPCYMDYSVVRYFAAVAGAVRKSTRFEIFHFLGVGTAGIGQSGKIQVSSASYDYAGSLLPEAHSNFNDGFKIVSFYADPDVLLRTAYVLRKEGWRNSPNLYQRMISKPKIDSIRSYLKE
ncbi:hypothetical protein [Rhodovarius sp.]|uniref:hypothetical protein n=1 Tax=Rhodovarius sp. TaxID=2972673 RepID=UPI0033428A7F